MEHLRLAAGEVTLHAVAEGSGPPVVLLHGFPEFWYAWRAQLPALAAAAFRAVAPDLRGYNESDRPDGVKNYTLEKLAADVNGFCRALGQEKVRLVGHDWGGFIAWAVAHQYPELVERLAILNAPHPELLRRALASPAQLAKLWYAFFFQLPWLPENRILQPWFLPRALRGLSRNKAAFSDQDLARYGEALRKPGAATAILNYYRAAPWSRLRLSNRIEVPTLVIWGEQDRVLGNELNDGLDRYVANLRIERLPGAGHWVQHDEPATVNKLLIGFFEQQIVA